MKNIRGINTVDVSLNQGLATVTLNPDNTVTYKQLQNAITRNGFTTKQSDVVVAGVLLNENGALKLKVSGTSDVFTLTPDSSSPNKPSTLTGKSVVVTGAINEKADTLKYRAIDAQP